MLRSHTLHLSKHLEAQLGRKFGGLGDHYLLEAADPHWRALSDMDKREWKERAKHYKKSDEFLERNRIAKAKKTPTTKDKKAEDPAVYDMNDADFGGDFDLGVPFNSGAVEENNDADEGNARGGAVDGDAVSVDRFAEKRQADRDKLLDFFLNATGATLRDIKRCRFLFMSVQSLPLVDRKAQVPMELHMAEMTLKRGIIEEYTALLADFVNLSQRDRMSANIYAVDAHKIPLNHNIENKHVVREKATVLREILGRSEPGIAIRYNINVGLYRLGIVEFEDERPDEVEQGSDDEDDWDVDGREEPEEKAAGGKKKQSKREKLTPLMPGDLTGRRWIFCLESEIDVITQSLQYLKQHEKIDYDGIPTEPSRFIFLDVLIDALAAFVAATASPDYAAIMEALSRPDVKELRTPWDRQSELYCEYHRNERNRFCAVAVGRKSCFTLFHALRQCYELPFGDNAPSAGAT